MFRRLTALRNDVGLLSEEYDPSAKRLVGNFPQAFSEVALINCAYNLTLEEKPVERRTRPTIAYRGDDGGWKACHFPKLFRKTVISLK
jgi:hypothetical protein